MPACSTWVVLLLKVWRLWLMPRRQRWRMRWLVVESQAGSCVLSEPCFRSGVAFGGRISSRVRVPSEAVSRSFLSLLVLRRLFDLANSKYVPTYIPACCWTVLNFILRGFLYHPPI